MINSAPSGTLRKSAPACLRRIPGIFAVIGGLGLLSGCIDLGRGGTGTVQVLRETPAPIEIVVQSGMSPPPACVIGVREPPPPDKIEHQPIRPSKDAVWQAGNWRYYSGQYTWVAGHWSMPPRPHAVYEQPHWSVNNGNHMFTEGYWHF